MRGRLAISCTLGRRGDVISVTESRMAELESQGVAWRLPSRRTYETKVVVAESAGAVAEAPPVIVKKRRGRPPKIRQDG